LIANKFYWQIVLLGIFDLIIWTFSFLWNRCDILVSSSPTHLCTSPWSKRKRVWSMLRQKNTYALHRGV